MTTFTFVGCSFTVGVGLELEKNNTNNYVNIVSRHFNAHPNNLAVGGNSNYNIFMSALNELLYSDQDILFVQWTSLNRLWLYPGPDTKLSLAHTITNDYSYRDLFFSKKDLQKVADTYHLLNHDYCNLMTLIDYSKILESIAGKNKIIFINGLVPWTEEIQKTTTSTNYAQTLSKYFKDILDFDHRDDKELDELVKQLSNKINSLQQSKWVNMFDSFQSNVIDFGNDNQHPGPESHKLYANQIINYLKEQQ